MLEILAKQGWKNGRELASKFFRRVQIFASGVWIVILVVTLVGGRMIWVGESRPPHRHEMADAFGSTRLFYDTQVNHSGSQFAYVATSDHGCGLFLYDIASGQTQMLNESTIIKGGGWWGKFLELHVWAWSPDDGSFICASQGKLSVYVIMAKAFAPLNVEADAVSDIAWLNSAEFAYIIGETNLFYARRQLDGQWKSNELSRSNKEKMSSLTAITGNTLAWLQDGFICRVNLTEDMTGTNNPWVRLDSGTSTKPPTDGLALWLDASTLRQPDQTPVAVLPDLSSRRNDAVSMDNAPIYNAPDGARGLNGRATIHFASNGDVANATGLKTKFKLGLTGAAPRTVFAVMRRDDGRQMLINLGDTVTQGTYFGLCAYYYGLCLPDACGVISVIHQSSVDWNVLEATYNGTNENGYVNGIFDSSMKYPLDTVDKQVEIGERSANTKGDNATASDGDFAELLVYNRALDDAERQKVEEFLSVKWFNLRLLTAQNPLVWYNPKLNGITAFTYSKEAGEFLLTRNADDHDSLWRFQPGNTGKSGKLSKIAEADSIQNGQWIGTKDIVYIDNDAGHKKIMLAGYSGTGATNLLETRDLDWFQAMPGGKELLIRGALNNEPSAGIWQYDLDSQQLHPLISYSDHPSTYAKDVDPFICSIKTPDGRKLDYFLYMPAHFDRHKKYPLVIGCTPFWAIRNHRPYERPWLPGVVATCGAFVVAIDRAEWYEGLDQWGDNVMDVYQGLIQNPCIDKQRVFLFGASAETQYMCDFMIKSPGLWNGVILLNPGGLPDFSYSPRFQQRPRILVCAGSEEHEDDRLKQYQLGALKSGAVVDVIIHSGEGHHLVGNAAQLERTRAIQHFIFDE